mmetsp:Transcript_49412/g.122803  ORF Transcript_49412/g.122803 Transcript_49412/m.122803 type:complete len:249 (+) Transcript_49412:630-1376(+)
MMISSKLAVNFTSLSTGGAALVLHVCAFTSASSLFSFTEASACAALAHASFLLFSLTTGFLSGSLAAGSGRWVSSAGFTWRVVCRMGGDFFLLELEPRSLPRARFCNLARISSADLPLSKSRRTVALSSFRAGVPGRAMESSSSVIRCARFDFAFIETSDGDSSMRSSSSSSHDSSADSSSIESSCSGSSSSHCRRFRLGPLGAPRFLPVFNLRHRRRRAQQIKRAMSNTRRRRNISNMSPSAMASSN